MGLGKLIVMGIVGLSTIARVAYTGYYAAGGKTERKGASAAVAEFISACISGLCFLALYLDW